MSPSDEDRTLLHSAVPRDTLASAITGDSTAQTSEPAIPPPAIFGEKYKILSHLGEGGFGIVYLADQTEPVRRKVALKVMKMAFASASSRARFEAEKQALAIMDHPGLAKVFDAGTTPDGQPYFAMEYAAGEPLATFCEHQRMDIRGRMTLLAQICDAIQHAHMKGVVHRDLKPGNILVCETDEGFRAKVIDFGISKAVSASAGDNALETQFGQFVGTPVYMSPEQAEGGSVDIDTRSDIYSIGVILYELLVTKTPIESETFHRSGLARLHRTIMETEPLRPSARLAQMNSQERKTVTDTRRIEFGALERDLKRDLDWITMRCLEKDRTRRYESASGLAADLRRYLDGEAVLAGPPGTRYRMGKFVRRNRIAVVAGCTVAVGIMAFAVVMGLLWSKAEKQQQRAQQTLDVFLSSLKSSNVSGAQTGSAVTVQDFLKLVEKEAGEKLKTQPDIANDVRETIGPVFTSLTDYESAARTMMSSVQYRRDLAAHGGSNENIALANSLHEYGRALYWEGRLADSRAAYEEALKLRRQYLPLADPLTAKTMLHLSMVYGDLNELALSDKLANESIQLTREIEGDKGEELARALFSRATTLCKAKRFDDARIFADESIQVLIKNGGSTDWRLGRNLALLSDIELARGRADLSLIHQKHALELITPRYGLNHPTVTAARHKLAETLCLLATATQDIDATTPIKDAALFDEAIQNAQMAVDGRRHEGNYPRNLAASLMLLSKLSETKGDLETSIAYVTQSATLLRERAPQSVEEISVVQKRLVALQALKAARTNATLQSPSQPPKKP